MPLVVPTIEPDDSAFSCGIRSSPLCGAVIGSTLLFPSYLAGPKLCPDLVPGTWTRYRLVVVYYNAATTAMQQPCGEQGKQQQQQQQVLVVSLRFLLHIVCCYRLFLRTAQLKFSFHFTMSLGKLHTTVYIHLRNTYLLHSTCAGIQVQVQAQQVEYVAGLASATLGQVTTNLG